MKAHIGITEKNGQSVVNELSKILADEFVLYTKTRKAHWNLEGPDFFEKHTFFELQYRQLEEFIDEVAERIRKLGFYTPASLTAFLGLTQLSEVTSENNDSKGFIKELLIDHESVIINLRENISKFDKEFHDAGSTDFITGLMEEHEKMAWILRSHL